MTEQEAIGYVKTLPNRIPLKFFTNDEAKIYDEFSQVATAALEIMEQVKKEHSQTNAWQEVYNKVLQLEQDYAENGDTETVSNCIKLENLLNYFKDELYEPNNNGWIDCKDRLPESNKPVLCWVKSTTIASGETFIIGSCSNKFWFLQTYEIGHHHFPVKDYEVVAWQALPESYKEGEEEC